MKYEGKCQQPFQIQIKWVCTKRIASQGFQPVYGRFGCAVRLITASDRIGPHRTASDRIGPLGTQKMRVNWGSRQA